MSKRTSLYRHRNATGELLYVGITSRIGMRTSEHCKMSEWAHEIASIEVCHFDTREEAVAAEVAAIKSEKPKYNFMHNRPDKRDDGDDDDCVRLIRRIVELRPIYTVAEVARVLDVSDGTVRGLIKSGQMGSVNIGSGAKSTRITGWQLIDYIESIGGK